MFRLVTGTPAHDLATSSLAQPFLVLSNLEPLQGFYLGGEPYPTTVRQPGLRAWYVLDRADLRERIRERTVEEMVEATRRVGGKVLRAEDLKELAEKLAEQGVPRENLVRTLRKYNAAVDCGRGGELSPPRSDPAALVQIPPLTAVEVAPKATAAGKTASSKIGRGA